MYKRGTNLQLRRAQQPARERARLLLRALPSDFSGLPQMESLLEGYKRRYAYLTASTMMSTNNWSGVAFPFFRKP